MSGICGRFHRDQQPASAAQICAMLATIRHRGPDGESHLLSGPVGFGHCMLRIAEESLQERQPHAIDQGRLFITADARIDNRDELLAALSDEFREPAATDAEIILSAYRKWGEECPSRLLGDFAFAIWDNRQRRLFCACDPMGVKSLYYHVTARTVSFASEIKALLALPDVPRRLNEMRVAEYLTTLFEDRSGTFYRDIFRLPGAHSLTVTAEDLRLRQYWTLDPGKELRLRSDGEYVEAFRDLFLEAVRCRTRSAFPVGAALSGGLDSSSIACAARNVKPSQTGPLRTYSLIFPGLPQEALPQIDERPFIQSILDTGGFQPTMIEADRLSPMHQIEKMHFHLDHANYAPNLYLHWAMYDSARRQGVRVFLDGFDGDATVSHGFERLAEMAQTGRWFALGREIKLLSKNHLAGVRPRRIFKEYCVKPLSPRWVHLAAHRLHGRSREAGSQNIFISSELKRRTDIVERARALLEPQIRWTLRRTARENHWMSLNQALYAYTLEVADKASAAFGIEARYPFFDRRLMEFCLAIPAEQKLAHGWNRWVQRRAMQQILPPEIQWRPRKGNLGPNFYHRLWDFEHERLEAVAVRGVPELEPYVNPDAMRTAYREYAGNRSRGQGECLQLFAAVNLALWLRAAQFEA
jgi:asparagine synthase (glutamine-hydrolysing)